MLFRSSKFGLEIRDTDSFVLSRRSFLNTVPGELRMRPQEGDLVYVPVLHKMYEIKFVENELMFHSIGKRLPFVYEMRCEAFRGSQEPMNTGVQEIDNVAAENNYTMQLTVGNPISEQDFLMGETVFQSANGNIHGAYAQAVVKEWFASNNNLYVYNVVGQFDTSANLIGSSSLANWHVISTDTMTDFNNYDLFDNRELNTDAGIILDLSETNPFGTP